MTRAELMAIRAILKKRFPNLTTLEVIDLATTILVAVEDKSC